MRNVLSIRGAVTFLMSFLINFYTTGVHRGVSSRDHLLFSVPLLFNNLGILRQLIVSLILEYDTRILQMPSDVVIVECNHEEVVRHNYVPVESIIINQYWRIDCPAIPGTSY